MNRVGTEPDPGVGVSPSSADARTAIGIRSSLSSMVSGTVGALLGTICCLLPAVAIAVGLTGGVAAALVSVGQFRVYGIVAGFTFVAILSGISVWRAKSCCTPEEYKRRRIAIPLVMLTAFGLVYGVVMYIVVPLLYRFG